MRRSARTEPVPGKTARECALSLLEYRDRTTQEMRWKLAERGYEPDQIEEAVGFLTDYRYLDDAEYARRYIRSAAARKSIRQLRQELSERGVDREILDVCLEEAELDEEAVIRAFLNKKGYETGVPSDPETRRKLTASLGRRGFSFDAIRRVMEEAWE